MPSRWSTTIETRLIPFNAGMRSSGLQDAGLALAYGDYVDVPPRQRVAALAGLTTLALTGERVRDLLARRAEELATARPPKLAPAAAPQAVRAPSAVQCLSAKHVWGTWCLCFMVLDESSGWVFVAVCTCQQLHTTDNHPECTQVGAAGTGTPGDVPGATAVSAAPAGTPPDAATQQRQPATYFTGALLLRCSPPSTSFQNRFQRVQQLATSCCTRR